jgi:GH24 family phage-related lysozyme (muramidase)
MNDAGYGGSSSFQMAGPANGVGFADESAMWKIAARSKTQPTRSTYVRRRPEESSLFLTWQAQRLSFRA